jgi:hypothetical protein
VQWPVVVHLQKLLVLAGRPWGQPLFLWSQHSDSAHRPGGRGGLPDRRFPPLATGRGGALAGRRPGCAAGHRTSPCRSAGCHGPSRRGVRCRPDWPARRQRAGRGDRWARPWATAPKVWAIAPGIDHCHHRNVEATGDIGSRRRTVEQPHDAFEQNQIGIFGRASQPPARIFLAAHAEIEVLARATTGDGVNLRIKKIRAAFENGDAPALASVQPGQCGGHGGFALTGGRRGNQEGGTGGHFSSLLAVGSIRTGLPVFRLRRFRCPIRHCASSG